MLSRSPDTASPRQRRCVRPVTSPTVAEGHWRAVRVDDVWVAGIAVAAGLGVVLAGPSPTGSTLVDVVLIVAAVAVCISMIATAPWTRNWRGSKRPIVAAALLGVGVQVLARLGNKWHFGCSAVLAVAPVVLLKPAAGDHA